MNDNSAKNYLPLIIIIGVILAASLALAERSGGWMAYFMGLFFSVFSMFKLLDRKGFEKAFKMYDEAAKKYPAYAKFYPFIELVLGLLYLSGRIPVIANLLTIIVMSLGAYSIMKNLKNGSDMKCACLGTIVSLPLTTISAVENIGMGLMAFLSLVSLL